MPAQAKAAFDRLVGRIDEIAFGRDVAGKGKAAGKDQRAAYEDVATCVFHHVFPEIDYRARAGGREVVDVSHAPAQAGRVEILTVSIDSLGKDLAGQCAIPPPLCLLMRFCFS